MTFCNEGNHKEKWAVVARGQGQRQVAVTRLVTCHNSKLCTEKGEFTDILQLF